MNIRVITVISLCVISLFLGYFFISVKTYQKLVDESSTLADNQCLKINPILIQRKNSYLTSLKAKDEKAYWKETDIYLLLSRKYVDEQTKWLDTQKAYINRWDFQFFMPSYVKEAAKAQYTSYEADMESTKHIIAALEVVQLSKSIAGEELKKAMEQIKIRDAAEKRYNDIWDNPGKPDWRAIFITVPPTKCPKENFDIPDIQEQFNPNSPFS